MPGVQLFNPSYRPPTNWHGNLALGGLDMAGWQISANADYSRTLNGEGTVDLNLRRTPAFTLPEEDGRLIFVSPAGIVPATGAIAPGASRVTDRFGTVTDYLADLESRAFQLNVQASLARPLFGKVPVSLGYSFSTVRQQMRGFNGSTAGDPFLREWAPGGQPLH